ncbi:anti-anti-sigma regulatory factor (antagonist of anti-sigma factor) [Schinkia azotoformans MEV2011]|uniref:Anti-anti-sigma regulatory factor (Antagonist of anti-sigma factor) n=1 Tax=Schinkia azotoformans MEV2011 TaxID=1348973 RepID=A0A072NT51_SCHAZ|nr:STAS domain-containing protein [Schinkia azotoformans]KEF40053.1 anti-anti-sigma regulatory factor (antagonist of anti-sigma factor) [Schinkia azotoformans MEV2011]MEC1694749.1 STAS domain-containing protein [Schinkia azotoformans]MEC1716889.1 STAS domain-containing protein [Schinkia azotoformans]MEC1726432.1 STAS domain-containing protein [Schinkia azotoformans]MEC1743171.1 STAS domain-containing protein [Schinkia azotoformans]
MIFTSNDQVILLTWEDDITLRNNASFKDTMKELVKSDSKQLLLYLEGVQYLNSGALGVIADSVMEARKYQKELVVVATQNSVKEIFNIVKFGSFIKLFDSKEEALQFFKRDQHE